MMLSLRAGLRMLSRAQSSSVRGQMIRGTSGTLVLKVINSGLMLLISLVLARILGARGYGAYAYAISWVTLFAMLATAGLSGLLTREVARYRVLEDWPPLRGILRWSDRVVLLASLAFAGAGAASLWWLQPNLEPVVAGCLWVGLLLLPLMAILQLRGSSTRGLGKVVEAQMPTMVVLPGTFLYAVLGVYLIAEPTPSDIVGLRAAAALVATLVAAWLLRRFLPDDASKAVPEYRHAAWLRSAIPFLFLGTATIANQQIGIIMLGSIVSAEAAGIYDIAHRVAQLVGFVLLAVNMPLAPVVASLYARGELAQLQVVVVKSARVAAAGSCLIALALITFGPWLLRLFGRDFEAGLPVLVILCIGQVLNAAAGSVGLVLSMTGHERDTAKAIGIAAVSQVCFNLVLIPPWGILGAAIGEAASTVLWNVLLVVWVWRRLGVRATAFGTAGGRE
jgi:O-antigen/teichoic acid export membrane protein